VNAGGSTTVNYRWSADPLQNFFRISHGTLGPRLYDSTSGTLDLSGVPAPSVDPVVSPAGPGIALIQFSGGTDGLAFEHNAPEAQFAAEISLSINVFDADSVGSPDNPATFDNSITGFIEFDAGDDIRYGRLRFQNAYGSELVDLPVPLRAEYFAGSALGFVANVLDVCSSDIELSFGTYTDDLNDGDTCAFDNGAPGESNVGCPAPGPVAQQYIEPPNGGNFNLNLAAPGNGNSGGMTVTATVPDWLKFDWDQTAAGSENPTGQVTFGLFNGEAAQIYLREIY
jgi:MSHA biogenesis protein MshQ